MILNLFLPTRWKYVFIMLFLSCDSCVLLWPSTGLDSLVPAPKTLELTRENLNTFLGQGSFKQKTLSTLSKASGHTMDGKGPGKEHIYILAKVSHTIMNVVQKETSVKFDVTVFISGKYLLELRCQQEYQWIYSKFSSFSICCLSPCVTGNVQNMNITCFAANVLFAQSSKKGTADTVLWQGKNSSQQ